MRVNPYAPPTAPSQSVAAAARIDATHVQYGKFAVRAGARLIDYIFEIILSMAGAFAAGILVALVSGPQALSNAQRGSTFAVSIGVGLLGNIAYFALGDGVGGATLGKVLLGLRVRKADLTPCRFSNALGRSLAFYVDSFFFGMIAYVAMQNSPREQRLGDKWANTVVVRDASLPPDAPRPSAFAGIMLGSVARIAFGALAIFAQHL